IVVTDWSYKIGFILFDKSFEKRRYLEVNLNIQKKILGNSFSCLYFNILNYYIDKYGQSENIQFKKDIDQLKTINEDEALLIIDDLVYKFFIVGRYRRGESDAYNVYTKIDISNYSIYIVNLFRTIMKEFYHNCSIQLGVLEVKIDTIYLNGKFVSYEELSKKDAEEYCKKVKGVLTINFFRNYNKFEHLVSQVIE